MLLGNLPTGWQHGLCIGIADRTARGADLGAVAALAAGGALLLVFGSGLAVAALALASAAPPGDRRDLGTAIDAAEEALALMRREHLRSLLAEQHDTLGRLHWAAGDRALGLEHARMSIEVLEDVGYIEHDDEHLPRLLGTYGEPGVLGAGGAMGGR